MKTTADVLAEMNDGEIVDFSFGAVRRIGKKYRVESLVRDGVYWRLLVDSPLMPMSVLISKYFPIEVV